MKDALLNALTEAVSEIAETMLFVEIIAGEVQIQGELQLADISAVVGYSGGLNGGLRLGGAVAVALKVAGALLGEQREAMDPELQDAFGEMANMIAGGVQTRVEGVFGAISMTPPMVVEGRNHQIAGQHSSHCVCRHFEMDGSCFFCEIYFAVPE